MLRKGTAVFIALLTGMVIFDLAPLVGLRWMDGHMGIWHLIWIVFPLIICPLVFGLVALSTNDKKPSLMYGSLLAMAALMPESVLLLFREFREFAEAKLWSNWDAAILLITFLALSCISGTIAPLIIRLLRR
jgi:hypothetical protein